VITCGVKFTHDGAVAIMEGNRLLACVEMEKVANRMRHSELRDTSAISELLESEGLTPDAIERFVIDGWQDSDRAALVHTKANGASLSLAVAEYSEGNARTNLLAPFVGDGLPIGDGTVSYRSYRHTVNHVTSAYCTSPFAQRQQDALVLVWDGGLLPRLYEVSGERISISSLGPVCGMVGSCFPIFAMHFEPFIPSEPFHSFDDLWATQLVVPGKAMAYAALGSVRPEIVQAVAREYKGAREVTGMTAFAAARAAKLVVEEGGYSAADAIASFQAYVGDLLVASLARAVERRKSSASVLCLTGGCALNIKWNSQLRQAGLFDDVWVPPFPNDAGIAIGAACSDVLARGSGPAIEWDVYAGPRIAQGELPAGVSQRPCTPEEVGELLAAGEEPVMVLDGRAELGPRALGNRSILASPCPDSMKAQLNEVKDRAWYRPVAPVCLEDHAADVFDPGQPDPYMLFEHTVRPEWAERIPAVVHLDGSSRLQTINERQHETLTRILRSFHGRTGVPVLCNTSANLNGSGFFPDVASAIEWGRVGHVWSEGTLFSCVPKDIDATSVAGTAR
jgi:carbamoyltransferase